eukprot:821521_1
MRHIILYLLVTFVVSRFDELHMDNDFQPILNVKYELQHSLCPHFHELRHPLCKIATSGIVTTKTLYHYDQNYTLKYELAVCHNDNKRPLIDVMLHRDSRTMRSSWGESLLYAYRF